MSTPRRLGALILSGFVLVTTPLAAQQLEEFTKLEPAWNKNYLPFGKFVSGSQQPSATSAADKEAIDVGAKWYVYRFTALPTSAKPDHLSKMREQFKQELIDRADKKNNREFVNQFSPVLVQRFKDLLSRDFNDNKLAIVNAAPMLAEAARLNHDAISDYLVELLTAKDKHEVIKLYAAKGLKESFPAGVVSEDDEPLTAKVQKRKARDVKSIDALVTYIERPWPLKTMSQDEQNAINYLRREALESLGQAQVPAVSAVKGGAKIEGAVAPTLLRVLGKAKTIQPEPNLGERIEAGIGVAQLKYGVKAYRVPEYDPELGIYFLGHLIFDLANEYNSDRVVIQKKSPTTIFPWKVQSKRLELALKELTANAKGSPAEAKAKQLEETVANFGILKAMGEPKAPAADRLPEFRRFVDNTLKPKALQGEAKSIPVFKTLKGAEVELE